MNNVPAVAAEASLRRAARETGNRSRPIGSAANRTHIYSRPNLAVAIAPAASPRGTNHMLYLYARIRDFSHGTFVEIKERKKRNEKKPRICVTRRNCANRYSESSLVLAREFLRDFIPFPTRLSTRLDAIRRDSTRFDAIRRDYRSRRSRGNELIIACAPNSPLFTLHYLPRIYDASCLSPANTRLSEQYVITNKPCNRPLISSPSCSAISLPEMHFPY